MTKKNLGSRSESGLARNRFGSADGSGPESVAND